MGLLGSAVCTLAALTLLSANKVEVLPKGDVLQPIAECEAYDIDLRWRGLVVEGVVASTFTTNACRGIRRIDATTESPANISIMPYGGVCDTAEKAYYAQNDGFKALILYEAEGHPLMDRMMTGEKFFTDKVTIPIVTVDYKCMKTITETYPPHEYTVRITTTTNWSLIGVVALVIGLIVAVLACYYYPTIKGWCASSKPVPRVPADEDQTELESLSGSGEDSDVPCDAQDAAPNGDSSSSAAGAGAGAVTKGQDSLSDETSEDVASRVDTSASAASRSRKRGKSPGKSSRDDWDESEVPARTSAADEDKPLLGKDSRQQEPSRRRTSRLLRQQPKESH